MAFDVMVQEAAVLVVKKLIVYNSEPKSKSRIHVHYAPWDYVACFGGPPAPDRSELAIVVEWGGGSMYRGDWTEGWMNGRYWRRGSKLGF